MKIFVSGPMTGIEGYNLPRFRKVTIDLETHGYEVVNPGRRGVISHYSWSDYMRDAIRDLVDCDGVAVLDGWESSKGARLEVTIAMDLGMPVHLVDWWIVNRKVVAG